MISQSDIARIAAAVRDFERRSAPLDYGKAISGPIRPIYGKVSADWAKGTWAEVTIWRGPKGREVATSTKVRAYNRLGAIPKDKWIVLLLGEPIAAEC